MSKEIKINEDQKLYVIPCGEGFSCLGFEVAFKWTKAMSEEMKAPHLMPREENKGTLEGYAEYVRACDSARTLNINNGTRLNYQLTPQLIGLEGKRVEIVDSYGEKRRFTVGKSTGFTPVHLELKGAASSGGGSVMGAPFKSVKIIK